ncbi:MAG: helix-turn-helix transcriptional regulator [Candidatus Latescibacterota bacterium]
MSPRRTTRDAVDILHARCVGDAAERQAALAAAQVHAAVARTICELRSAAGLSQRELADRVGTTQSAIRQLEDEDYEGPSLRRLSRIATALDHELAVVLTVRKPSGPTRSGRRPGAPRRPGRSAGARVARELGADGSRDLNHGAA